MSRNIISNDNFWDLLLFSIWKHYFIKPILKYSTIKPPTLSCRSGSLLVHLVSIRHTIAGLYRLHKEEPWPTAVHAYGTRNLKNMFCLYIYQKRVLRKPHSNLKTIGQKTNSDTKKAMIVANGKIIKNVNFLPSFV